ncbi:class F sortase [Kitasatospora purpeofusca]|uniref:class F sortase n=1 Tax=Kitasatospora purpeofusca TaxID=67352 RepID=UPI002A5AB684|nr:class F sortase [Kitasatospora purpeofusca]MDY0816395.1 class F sortase [Kitasatospora purpeofusca]
MRGADNAPGSSPHPVAAGPDGGDGGRAARGHRSRDGSQQGRHGRRAGRGGTRLNRSVFGAAGLLCLAIGATVAVSGRAEPPVVRVETSARQAPDATAPAAPAPSVPAASAATGTGTAAAARPLAASAPTRLLIPAAGVDAPVTGLGLNGDGTVEVPAADRADEVGWYRNGPTPGETGPAVLIGHYDTAHGPAVFHNVPKLKPGDLIQVRREDGGTVDFRVRALLQTAKDTFPTDAVYGNTKGPELRLITCGGRIGADGHWTDNIVVLADPATPVG